jgi:hypothetical protein
MEYTLPYGLTNVSLLVKIDVPEPHVKEIREET